MRMTRTCLSCIPYTFASDDRATQGTSTAIVLRELIRNILVSAPNGLNPDSKVHGANMGPTWCRQDPGGPHVGPMNFAIWEVMTNT